MYCRFLQCFAFFTANGLIVGGWATAIPFVSSNAGLSETELSLVLLSFAVGGIAAMLITPISIAWFSTNRVSVASGVGFIAMFPVVVAQSELIALIATALAFGGCHGAMDVAMNSDVIEAERETGQRFMSKLHGCFSLGAALGAGIFGWIATDRPIFMATVYAATIATLVVLLIIVTRACSKPPQVQLVSEPQTLPESKALQKQADGTATAWRLLLAMGAIAFGCLVAEGAMVDWLVKLFQTDQATSKDAGFVYAAFAIGMSVCRFGGDRISKLVGDRRTIIVGCLISGVSLCAVLMLHNPIVACVPAMFAGAGLANVIPSTFRTCGADRKRLEQTLARVTIIGYTGFLFGPPMIGIIADATSLRTALVVPVATLFLASAIATLSKALR